MGVVRKRTFFPGGLPRMRPGMESAYANMPSKAQAISGEKRMAFGLTNASLRFMVKAIPKQESEVFVTR